MQKTVAGLFFCLLFLFIAQSAGAGLIVENDRSAFEAACSGLALEDFEAGTMDPGLNPSTGPLDSTTSNLNFQPGDIAAGVQFDVVHSFGNPFRVFDDPTYTQGIASSFRLPSISIGFTTTVNAFGVDLIDFGGVGDTMIVDVYGGLPLFDSNLLGSYEVQLAGSGSSFIGFEGVEISSVLIHRAPYGGGTIPGAYGIDNVLFGTTAVMPEPSSLLLLGGGFIGLVLIRKKRR